MSRQRTPSSVVVRYDDARKMLICNTVADDQIQPLCAGKLDIPVLLDDFDYQIDDEFARRFGGAVLSLLANYQPELKPFISFTEQPVSPSDRTPPAAPTD
ncbi:hypothetical protein AWB65_02368 [Caballeronia humi]|uniref:Uncharacterized protein n=1 Tax=Caballeronia humi TaxID=326474 RepID=A0A158GQM6_9BURK|nr:hypothetical protein AWB65_02368 [Caballeronia humi]